MRRKKTILIASITICMLLVGGVLVINGNKNHRTAPSEILTSNLNVDVDKLPTGPIQGSVVVDMENKNETVGFVDYVFVAKVISNDKTIYKDISVPWNLDIRLLIGS